MKRCAWISRHTPTHEQRVSLAHFQIVQINPPGRLWSAADAIALSRNACKGWPDLYVVVLPIIMLQHFVTKVDGNVPIIRAVMDARRDNVWTGRWEQITAVQITVQSWTPDTGKELQ